MYMLIVYVTTPIVGDLLVCGVMQAFIYYILHTFSFITCDVTVTVYVTTNTLFSLTTYLRVCDVTW